MKYRKLKYN